MQKHLIETLIGASVLVVAAGFLLFAYKGSEMSVNKASGYTIEARFANATGVSAGSDVRIGGVKIGVVTSMRLDTKNFDAITAMHISNDIQIPVDSTAAIVGSGLLSDKFIQITPGGDDAALKPGAMIKLTQSSVSLEELIGKFVFSGGGVDKGTSHSPSPAALP